MEPEEIRLSPMPKTWILDLDGTLVVHNGPYILGRDEFLPGAKEFLDSIPRHDMIILLTARSEYEKPHTLRFLKENHVRYDHIIFIDLEKGKSNAKEKDNLFTGLCPDDLFAGRMRRKIREQAK